MDQDAHGAFEIQEELINLRVVCHLFKALYDSEPRFRSRLILSSSFSEASLPSLTAWLQKHTGTIQSVAVLANFGSPFLDEVLQKLIFHSKALTALSLRVCSASILQLLPNFQRLTRLDLDFDLSETLTLNPLLSLPALETLQLTGEDSVFTMDELPRHLTGLSLLWCQLHTGPSLMCLRSLRTLAVSSSVLRGFHPHGLLAFHGLQHLVCARGCITASTNEYTLDGGSHGHCMMPSTLSTLTALTKLYLRLDAGTPLPDDELDLSCLYSLAALERLDLSAAGSMCITAGLSCLARLTCLEVMIDSVPGEFEYRSYRFTADTAGHLRLCVEWSAMPALQHVVIGSPTVFCDESLLTLPRMQHLTHIQFYHLTPQNFASSQIFAELVYLLATNRPEVVVCMGAKQLGNH